MSKRMSSGKRRDRLYPYEFDPKTMKARFKPPRAVDLASYRTDNTIVVPDHLFSAYLAAAQERREEDERKWQSLVDLYSNTCKNEGDK